ncbi:MAG: hypothetical protein GVY13_07365 [Alphaproteobacteria bacterium]|nr:hypothetical protein [Alphaproteobacteria bacterium]
MTDPKDEQYGLDFSIEKSMRYLQRRRDFFDRMHKLFLLLIILSGTASFASFFGSGAAWGLVTALLAATDLVFGLSDRARDHEFLRRRFAQLAGRLRATSDPTEADIHEWTRERIEIETDEPPTMWALEASCYNEVVHAWGRETDWGVVPLRWHHRLFMDVWPFAKAEFPPCEVVTHTRGPGHTPPRPLAPGPAAPAQSGDPP